MAASLDGKVALLTGSGSGIGRASALAVARDGARVVVADRDEAGGNETVSLIKETGGEATFVATDVSKADSINAAVARTVELYGSLDLAHNNAGIEGATVPIIDYPEEAFDQIVAVNLKGVWLSLKAEITVMAKQGHGAIVNTASTFGLVGVPSCTGYVATKHAVCGLTKATALEYARQGIRVNAVCPGAVDTPLLDRFFEGMTDDVQALSEAYAENHPVGRIGQSSEIGEAVAWLLSDKASFVTGITMPVDGGWTAQ